MPNRPMVPTRLGAALTSVLVVALALVLAVPAAAPIDARGKPPRATPTPMPDPSTLADVSIFGAWHCSDDYCTWDRVRDTGPGEDFDEMNHWLIDRDPSGAPGDPSVNLVVLSFVNPLTLQTRVTVDNGQVTSNPLAGVPVGMTQEIVDYFRAADIRVMLSIGGITYVDDWNAALAMGGYDLGLKAAAVASALGVGIEIDYEENTEPNLLELEEFIKAYRTVHEYDPTGADPQVRDSRGLLASEGLLTIDVAAGDRWLIALNRKATADWLRTADHPEGQDPTIALSWANAMVPGRQPSVDKAIANWQEHVDGKPQYAPPVPPLAPAKFTGGLYVAEGSQVRPECTDFAASLQAATETYVRTVGPNGAGTTSGMLGWMFWAAEKPSTRGVGTQPPNTCEGGMGVAATELGISIPMPALRTR